MAKNKITDSEIRKLKKIAKRIVMQSHLHQSNITKFYQILAEAAKNEFKEDNDFTLREFLEECNAAALGEIFSWTKEATSGEK